MLAVWSCGPVQVKLYACAIPFVWQMSPQVEVIANFPSYGELSWGLWCWHPLSSGGRSCQLGAVVLASIILRRKVLPAGGSGAGIHYPPEEGPASWGLWCWHPLSSGGRSCQLGAVVLASIILRRKVLPAGGSGAGIHYPPEEGPASRGLWCLAFIILQRKVLPAGGCGAGIHFLRRKALPAGICCFRYETGTAFAVKLSVPTIDFSCCLRYVWQDSHSLNRWCVLRVTCW